MTFPLAGKPYCHSTKDKETNNIARLDIGEYTNYVGQVSIASIMSLSADNDELLQTLAELDSRPEAEFEKSLEQNRFRANLGSSFTITLLTDPSPPLIGGKHLKA
jgi:hypothetical protein